METTIPTVTPTETDTCWSITPKGRAALRRRLAGHTSFTPSEVVAIAHALGMDALAFFHDTEEAVR